MRLYLQCYPDAASVQARALRLKYFPVLQQIKILLCHGIGINPAHYSIEWQLVISSVSTSAPVIVH
jgi:hypothetical protein